ncbi:hypothetical protein COV18_04475 [Candidatus Woesearchaeota archaeon CG10_big_fil_rev_8_21_14_0_10_37_12]|nr:MAG: hypothetical protein COV18_04475 [Candidatus Woesearchaeota archaeon CG10_big_fil_rev_8_21_14_0_10_37_12]
MQSPANFAIRNALKELKEKNNLDLIFLTCIDVEKRFNTFVVIDDNSKILLENALNITFENNVAKRNGIIMRKEIVPLLKELLESE